MAASSRILARQVANGVFVAFCVGVTLLALGALFVILWTLFSKGADGVNLAVFTQSTPAPGSPGGLKNAIVGSIMLCGFAMAIALLFGVLAGTWLAEYAGSSVYGGVVRFLNDVLLSAPSILIGVFVYWVLVKPLHGFSGYSGGVALALIATPIITRTTEDVLRLQPTSLRESGIALGSPFWHVVRTILWRAAGGGILTAALLAFARISGETAPLLFTSFGNQFFSIDMRGAVASLPQVIFKFGLSPYEDWQRLAWVGSLLVAVSVLGVTILARIFSQERKSE